jgi:NAD(P)-dependent dehydrogenase (short-subunit alcohol dehydrogenase family)
MARTGLEDKVIAVTGAASGIGRALALALARRGVRVALADRDASGLAETRQQLGNAHHVADVFDVRDSSGWQKFADMTVAAFGHVDGLVNNAGLSVVAPFADMDDDDFSLVMDVNFKGVVQGTRTFLPLVRARPQAWIVNISSVFGLMAFPAQSAYCASKFAVRGFTETLRLELAESDPAIQVICVHPGGIDTNVMRNARFVSSGAAGPATHDAAIDMFRRNTRTSPDQAAEVIVKAMESGQVRVRIGPDARFIDRLARLLPRSHFQVIGRLLR